MNVDFFNTFVLNKFSSRNGQNGTANYSVPSMGTLKFSKGCTTGSSWQRPIFSGGQNRDPFGSTISERWYIEESRIRGGFNNVSIDQGVRAYINEENIFQEQRINTLIYSGIYNSRTGVNNTNVFSVADSITKSLNISYGSIQKTFSEETNLIVFQENKIHRALIDKDTIYTTESGTQTQAGNAVIGQFVAYKGDYGISKNPESFAIYNYRKYFTDKNRNAVMRLSNDGLTEISKYGMLDYFRDNLAEISDDFENWEIETQYVSGGNVGDLTVVLSGASEVSPGMNIEGQPGYITYIETVAGGKKIFYSQPFISFLGVGAGRVGSVQLSVPGHPQYITAPATTTALAELMGEPEFGTGLTLDVVAGTPGSPGAITSVSVVNPGVGYATTAPDSIVVVDYQSGTPPTGFIGTSIEVTSLLPSEPVIVTSKVKGRIPGGWDIHSKNYVLSLQKNPLEVSQDETTYKTISFDEDINGWVSFFNYKPGFMFSNLNQYFSTNGINLMKHYHVNSSDTSRGEFNGGLFTSSVTFVLNAQPSVIKNFNTVFYEGSNGWEIESFVSSKTGVDDGQTAGTNVQYSDQTASVSSYNEGSYVDPNSGYTFRAGFDRKENRYVSNLKNNSTVAEGEVLFGAQMSGIKGYFATVTMKTDDTTNVGGSKELWAAGSNYVVSSY